MPGSATISWIRNIPLLETPVLTVTPVSTTELDVDWTNVSNESSFKLEWSANGISGWTQIGGTIAANTLTYAHTGLTAGTIYYYRITAVGDGVNWLDSPYGYGNATTVGIDLVLEQTVTNNDTDGSLAVALTGVNAGALLVFSMATQDDNGTTPADPTVTSSPSLTWTKQSRADANDSGNAAIYTAIFTAGGSITCNSTWGLVRISGTVMEFTNQEGTLGGSVPTPATSQSAPSLAITTTRDGSYVIGVSSDWNPVDGASRTYRESATETYYQYSAGNYAAYFYYLSVATAGAKTMGLSAPTGMSAGTCLIEIRRA